jgi:hypothetical protein
MNNLTTAKSSFKDQIAVIKRKHTWIMAFLYVGTFGSFIGYSAAFPLLIKTQFPAVTIAIAFLGPLVGSLSRPLGGLLADKVGGAIVTFWNFIAMAAATIGVLYFVGVKDFTGFLVMFLILFVTTGVGNGSTYRMIPSIFREGCKCGDCIWASNSSCPRQVSIVTKVPGAAADSNSSYDTQPSSVRLASARVVRADRTSSSEPDLAGMVATTRSSLIGYLSQRGSQLETHATNVHTKRATNGATEGRHRLATRIEVAASPARSHRHAGGDHRCGQRHRA